MQHLPLISSLLLQPARTDPLVRTLLEELSGSHRLVFTRRWLTFEESWASMAAADIGLVVYLQDGPQFQNMGVSSTKLCMYLQMGLPYRGKLSPASSSSAITIAACSSRVPQRRSQGCSKASIDLLGHVSKRPTCDRGTGSDG